MKIKVLKRTPNELRVEIEGEGHTFCNLLQKVLLEDEAVEMAGYKVPHPLASTRFIYIRTRGSRRPEEVLKEAVKKVSERTQEFKKAFNKALERWQNLKVEPPPSQSD